MQALYHGGTTLHLEQAVKDLRKANQIEPNNQAVGKLLAAWGKELSDQNRKDRSTFGGLFKRGELYEKGSVPDAGIPACANPHYRQCPG